MPDQIIKATAGGRLIRAVGAWTTDVVDEARHRHQTSPVATVALGRALTGGLLLSAAQQKQGRLTLRILGDGPLGAIVVDASTAGEVRGYLQNPQTELPVNAQGTFDLGAGVGREGFLHVTYSTEYGNTYTSTIELASGEIASDLTRYLALSEQIPSAVMLGVYIQPDETVGLSGGVIVQLMPGHGDEIAERLEANLATVPTFTELAQSGLGLEQIMSRVLEGFHVEFLERRSDVRFHCQCSRERVLGALATLGPDELEAMIREDHGAEVTCHFCADRYNLTESDLQELLTA